MKAAAIVGLGDYNKVRFVDVPQPIPQPTDAVVRVRAVGVNWLDVMIRLEELGLQFPHVPGSDIAGVVEKSARFETGTEVVLNPALACVTCRADCCGVAECQFVRILGLHTPGGYGERVAVPETQLFRKPDGISEEQAAAYPLDYLTAWRMLSTRGHLRPRENVLVWGASGGLGVAAIQLAHYLGAICIAAAGNEAYGDALRQVGANYVFNYKDSDFDQAILNVTNGVGCDLIFESVGHDTLPRSVNLVRAGGRIVICGTRSGNSADVDFSDVYYKQVSIIGSRMGTQRDFEEVHSLIKSGLITPYVGKVLPLSSAAESHRLLEDRDFVGKLVLKHEQM